MTKTIHHTISKQARNLGVSISLNGDDTMTFTHDFSGQAFTGQDPKVLIRQVQDHVKSLVKAEAPVLVKAKTGKIAKSAPKAKKSAKTAAGDPQATKKTLKTGKSGVMLLPYHTEYMNNGGGNGDQLDVALREAIMSVQGPKGGKSIVIMDNLVKIAKTHGVWNDRYESLNPGMARMNVSNRLRAMVRAGESVVIDGKKITKVRSRGGEDDE